MSVLRVTSTGQHFSDTPRNTANASQSHAAYVQARAPSSWKVIVTVAVIITTESIKVHSLSNPYSAIIEDISLQHSFTSGFKLKYTIVNSKVK